MTVSRSPGYLHPRRLLKLAAAAVLAALAPGLHAGPQGGAVIAGDGNIDAGTLATTITQHSQQLVIDWQSFDIAAGELVQFVQPSASAAALNRIFSQDATSILGSLTANGNVFLVNQNGFLFGHGASVQVGGLVTTNLLMDPGEFMAGVYRLYSDGDNAGLIINRGLIQAATGGVSLVSDTGVINEGKILANAATVNMATTTMATLDFDGDGLLRLHISGEVSENLESLDSAVSNSGEISVNDGEVLLAGSTARDVFSNVVNNSGVIRATGVVDDGGVVRLVAAGGDTLHSGSIDVQSAAGQGGRVEVLGDRVALTGQASIDASGAQGGGDVLIGGDYQGGNLAIANASHTYVGAETSISADAMVAGDGGRVIVWADELTAFHGDISATGGSKAGDGGFVETSGKDKLIATGSVDAGSRHGEAGVWLLDPRDVELRSVPDAPGPDDSSDGIFDGGSPDNTFTPDDDDDANIAIADIDQIILSLEAGTNVIITTTSSGTTGQLGDITVVALNPISLSLNGGDVSLTLDADNDIFVNADITTDGANALDLTLDAVNDITVDAAITGTNTSVLNMELVADSDGDGTGGLTITTGNTITSNNGEIHLLGALGSFDISGSVAAGTGDVHISTVQAAQTLTIDTVGNGGDITPTDLGQITSTGTITIGEAVVDTTTYRVDVVTVDTAVSLTDTSLALVADDDINVNAGISTSSIDTTTYDISLVADADGSGAGGLNLDVTSGDALTSSGGDINLLGASFSFADPIVADDGDPDNGKVFISIVEDDQSLGIGAGGHLTETDINQIDTSGQLTIGEAGSETVREIDILTSVSIDPDTAGSLRLAAVGNDNDDFTIDASAVLTVAQNLTIDLGSSGEFDIDGQISAGSSDVTITANEIFGDDSTDNEITTSGKVTLTAAEIASAGGSEEQLGLVNVTALHIVDNGAGNIEISIDDGAADDVNVAGNVLTASGLNNLVDFSYTNTHSSLTVGDVTAPGPVDVSIKTDNGSIDATGNIQIGGAAVFDANTSLTIGSPPGKTLTAASLTATAGTSIVATNAAITVAGDAVFTATGAITLDNTGNDFSTVDLNNNADAGIVTVVDDNSLILGDIDAGGNFNATAGAGVSGGDLSDSDDPTDGQVVAGLASFTAGSGSIGNSITLDNINNAYASFVAYDAGGSEPLTSIEFFNTAAVNILGVTTTSGSAEFNGTSISMGGTLDVGTTATLIARTGNINITGVMQNIIDLVANANTSITVGEVQVSGSASFTSLTDTPAGGTVIDATNPDNDFGTVNISVGTDGINTNTDAVAIRDQNSIVLGTIDIDGDLTVTAGKTDATGDITDIGDETSLPGAGGQAVGGNAVFDAGENSSIALDNANNSYGGTVAFSVQNGILADLEFFNDSLVTLDAVTTTGLLDITGTSITTIGALGIGGSATLTATATTISLGDTVTADSLNLTAETDISTTSTLGATNNATLTATTGGITLGNTLTAGSLNMSAATAIDTAALNLGASGGATIDSSTAGVTVGGTLTAGSLNLTAETAVSTAVLTITNNATLDSNTAGVNVGGTLTADSLNLTAATTIDTQVLTITNNATLGATGGAVTVVGTLDAGSLDVTAGAGITATAGAVTTGDASFTSDGAITLTNVANDFSGSVDLDNSANAAAVAIVDVDDIELGRVDVGGDLNVTAGTAVAAGDITDTDGGGDGQAVVGSAVFNAGFDSSIILDNAVNSYSGLPAFNVQGGTLNNLAFYNTAAVALPMININGFLDITGTSISTVFGNTITAGGSATLTATGATITLGDSLSADSLNLTAETDISTTSTLGATNNATLTATTGGITLGNTLTAGSLNMSAATAIDTAALNLGASGGATIDSSTAGVTVGGTLTAGSLNLTAETAVSTAVLTITNNAALDSNTAGVNVGGTLTADSLNLTAATTIDTLALTITNNATLGATGGAVTVVGTLDAGSLDVTAGAGITATAGAVTTGDASFTSDGAITLTNIANDFSGSVDLDNSANAAAVAIVDVDDIELGRVDVGGDLNVTAGTAVAAGDITDTDGGGDGQAVGGNAVFEAGLNSAITLDNANNAYSGTLTFDVQFGALSSLTFLDTTAVALDAVTTSGLLAITGSSISTGAGDILNVGTSTTLVATSTTIMLGDDLFTGTSLDMSAGTAINTSGALSVGTNAVLDAATAGITLGDTVSASSLGLTAQTGIGTAALNIGGSATATSNTADIVLGANATANSLDLNAATDIETSSLNITTSAVLDATAGDITVDGTVTAGSLTLVAGDSIDTAFSAISVGGVADLAATAGSVSLGGGISAGILSVSAGTDIIANTGAVSVVGPADFTATGAIDLSNSGNDFSAAVDLDNNANAAAVAIADANDILLGDIAAGGALIVTAGSPGSAGNITGTGVLAVTGNAVFDAGLNSSVTLSNGASSFGGSIDFNGQGGPLANITLLTGGDVDLLALSTNTLDISAGGAIGDSGAQSVTSTAVLSAGTAILLDEAGNDYQSTIDISAGGNATLFNDNAVTLGTTVNVAGTLAVTANGNFSSNGTIDAATLLLDAVTMSAITTSIDTLGITISGISDITVTDSGSLAVAGSGIVNPSGFIALLVDNDITLGGNVSVTSTNDVILLQTASGGIEGGAGVLSTGGSLGLNTQDNIGDIANNVLTSVGGLVLQTTSNTDGSIYVSDSGSLSTSDLSISTDIGTAQDILLAADDWTIDTNYDIEGDNLTLVSNSGGIVTTATSQLLNGNDVVLDSATGIGALNQSIQVSASTLQLVSNGADTAGDIYVTSASGIDLNAGITTNAGSAQNIVLEANNWSLGSDLSIANDNLILNAVNGTIDGNSNSITASSVGLIASGNIFDIITDTDTIAARSTTGSINIASVHTGTLAIGDLGVVTGLSTTDQAITLVSTDASIDIANTVDAGAGAVTLTTTESVVSADHDIGGSGAITAGGNLVLVADGGITGVNVDLQGSGDLLLTSNGNGAAGDITVTSSNALTTSRINTLNPGSGTQDITLTAESWSINSDISVPGDNLILIARTGNITRSSGTLSANDISLTVDALDASIGGNLNNAAMININLTGELVASAATGDGGIYINRPGGALAIGAAGIDAGSGDIQLAANGAITSTGSMTANNLLLVGTGDITTDTAVNGLAVSAVSGDVTINQTGALLIASLSAADGTGYNGIATTGDVSITATGSISDAAGASIQAADLVLTAGGGITLDSAGNSTASFNATDTAGGDITLAHQGLLVVTGISTGGNVNITNDAAINASGGAITAGTLNVVTVGDAIFDNAGNDIGGFSAAATFSGDIVLVDSGALALGAVTTTGAGDIDISTDGSISQQQVISTGSGDISITSTAANIAMAVGSRTTTSGGNISYTTSGANITVANLNTGTAAGTIDISTGGIGAGSVTNANGPLSTDPNVRANTVNITTQSIGGGGIDFGLSSDIPGTITLTYSTTAFIVATPLPVDLNIVDNGPGVFNSTAARSAGNQRGQSSGLEDVGFIDAALFSDINLFVVEGTGIALPEDQSDVSPEDRRRFRQLEQQDEEEEARSSPVFPEPGSEVTAILH